MNKEFTTDTVCVLLVGETGDIIGQERDDKPGINNPGKVGYFGGYMEPTDTSHTEAALRELHEETNLRLTPADLEPFAQYFTGPQKSRMRHNVFIAKGISTNGLQVYEGKGFYTVTDPNDPMLTPVMKQGAEAWFKERDAIYNATAADPAIHRCANTFFVTPNGDLYGHQRDDKPGIDQPGKIGAFGGAIEAGETPLIAAVRELEEETNLHLTQDDLEFFGRWVMWRPLTREYEQSNVYIARNVNLDGIQIYEGQGIAKITELNERITLTHVPAVKKWFGKS